MRYSIQTIITISSLLLFSGVNSQNLLTNPGAEAGAPSSTGWTAVSSGTNCDGGSGWRVQGNQAGYPTAVGGTYIFFTGCGGTGNGANYELRQDINISANAAAVDASAYHVTFSGYTQSYSQASPDQATIIIEYRNSTNTSVLANYSSGATTNLSSWVQYTNTQTAPIGTRYLRVRLISTNNNGSAIDGYYDNISVTALSTLPVNYLSFSAVQSTTSVKLTWSTSEEKENSGFEVLHSTDGISWSKLGFVSPLYSGQPETNYSFLHANPSQGSNYYRLKQIDKDGQFNLSKIISVAVQQTEIGKIFPNPANSVVYFPAGIKPVSYTVMNVSGQIVMKGSFMNKLDISHLAPGKYILQYVTPAKKISEVLIKL